MMRKALALSALCAALATTANAQIVANFEQGGKIYWRFLSGQYNVTGALTLSGNIAASDPLEFTLQDLNNDGLAIDIELRVEDLFPDLGINYTLNLVGSVVSENANEAIIRWAADANPNQCITVNIDSTEINVFITRLAGALQARVTPISCRANPYDSNWQEVTLQFEDNGGDGNNFLLVEGYLFCQQNQAFFAEARIFNMDWEAY
ncbi:MAG: hypothetical protein ACK4ME_10725, partial [Fimbriimonadales bacterium]